MNVQMKGNAKLLSFILWVSSNFLCSLGQRPTPRTTPGPDPPTPDYYYPGDYPLWCFYCRSDKDNACINNVVNNQDKFTKPCTNETLLEFNKDLQLTKPDRPVIEPRAAGDEVKWVCWRMYTLDQTFTLRACQKLVHPGASEAEECHACEFDKVKAKCCTCLSPNCNYKNSDATKIVFKQPVIILTIIILCISLIFI